MSVDNDYEFRVIALNKGGESEASPVSNTIHAMIRFIKPKINRDVFPTEKTIHASQTLKWVHKQSLSTTSNMDRQLLCQKFSVMKTNKMVFPEK